MDKIAKIKNGSVVICNTYGGQIFSFRLGTGGDATFADINPKDGRILVTSEKGTYSICSESGGCIASFSGSAYNPIVMATWMGDDILVRLSNGQCEVRNQSGGVIRRI